MKNIIYVLFLYVILFPVSVKSQVEKVIVEKYYVSDANDATDTIGGYLEEGSITYRIYIDLVPGSKLTKIYGDTNHIFKISSTAIFFNNKYDGQSFGKDFHKNRYEENTVALDSWLTLGQTTTLSSKTYFGVLKTEDRNGSFIGGSNNDGGSTAINGGLLTNTDSSSGIPLTTSDGMDSMTMVPSNWFDSGIRDIVTGNDSSIFGSLKTCSQFISRNASLQNSGVSGVIADSNQVLVAQLTTKGEISFELNVEIIDSNGQAIKYVADDSILLTGEVYNRFLKYPYTQTCGCPDPDYLEYAANRDCDNLDLCNTLIVFGCMDTLACNYNADANFNIQELCCYPGYCNDRDISVVCPQVITGKFNPPVSFDLYPNPAQSEMTLQFLNEDYKETKYIIYNSIGKMVMEKNIGILNGSIVRTVDLQELPDGLYLFNLFRGESLVSKMFVKNN